jgi:hypothetical protein
LSIAISAPAQSIVHWAIDIRSDFLIAMMKLVAVHPLSPDGDPPAVAGLGSQLDRL